MRIAAAYTLAAASERAQDILSAFRSRLLAEHNPEHKRRNGASLSDFRHCGKHRFVGTSVTWPGVLADTDGEERNPLKRPD
ncbi:hypothetical protein ACFC1R_34075 [Kitasatospora sp. NPDC056138]|uniref:hypothetical protein n=1 Tax=Kitasatospora sp. NPDC056138 TaxID=3345724 RepID=UPI0035E26F52